MLNCTVMMYHYVRDAGDAAQGDSGIRGLPKAQFAAQLDTLARTYNMVSWKDVQAAVLGKKDLPENACLLTFDDGSCDHYLHVFPALQARGMSGLFFGLARQNETGLILAQKLHYLLAKLGLDGMRRVIWNRLDNSQRESFTKAEEKYRARWRSELDQVKGVLQRDLADEINPLLSELVEQYVGSETTLAQHLYLTPEQIREMRAGGMHFGGHSRTHPWFDYVNAERREKEIAASSEWLGAVEQVPFAFAYPYGGLAEDAPKKLADAGFAAAFTTKEGTTHADPFYIGRYDGEAWHA